MTIRYTKEIGLITSQMLSGFFVDWPNYPNQETHLEILHKSYVAWIALDGNRCVGFVNALSDGIFYAYIPLLEVLPEYQGKGIGSELIKRIIDSLSGMYAIDVVCDEYIAPFYESKNFKRRAGMIKRNYKNQNGRK